MTAGSYSVLPYRALGLGLTRKVTPRVPDHLLRPPQGSRGNTSCFSGSSKGPNVSAGCHFRFPSGSPGKFVCSDGVRQCVTGLPQPLSTFLAPDLSVHSGQRSPTHTHQSPQSVTLLFAHSSGHSSGRELKPQDAAWVQATSSIHSGQRETLPAYKPLHDQADGWLQLPSETEGP